MMKIPQDHPRVNSLKVREKLVTHWKRNVVADTGLIAHGRGEAFDYLFGEITISPAMKAVTAASAHLLLASYPVISVNGNVAALVARDMVQLAEVCGAKLEVNLFHRTSRRIKAASELLYRAGAKEVLGLKAPYQRIPEVSSERRVVDPHGIPVADVVLVPLEDGDRVEALRHLGKVVIAIDLNPLSRTAVSASVTIVDNIIRAAPNLITEVATLRKKNEDYLRGIVGSYDNRLILAQCLRYIEERLEKLSGSLGDMPRASHLAR